MQSQMTATEKLRLQSSATELEVDLAVDWQRLPLTRLILYWLSLDFERRQTRQAEFEPILYAAAQRTLQHAPLKLGKVAAVLDCSYSSSGSSEKRRRPLAIALAVHYLLQVAAQTYQPFWTIPISSPLLVSPHGQTDLATPLLAALATHPDLVIIVSDGYENDPPDAARVVLDLFRTHLDKQNKIAIVHCNPVFDAEAYALRRLSLQVPTVGLRDAEDLPTMLGFARFAEGAAPLSELEAYLAVRVEEQLGRKPKLRQGATP
jgi:hypothetical protein